MIRAMVIHGEGVGKNRGYPTANLSIQKSEHRLPNGVYAAEATLRRKTYHAALVVNEKPLKMEIYLIDYRGKDFYGDHITVNPIQKVSQFEACDSLDELKQKIAADMELVTRFFEDYIHSKKRN